MVRLPHDEVNRTGSRYIPRVHQAADSSTDSSTDSSEDGLPDLLVAAARALRRGWAAAVEPWGLSPHQARALRAVGETPEQGLRPSDLARRLRIAPRSATEVVDALVERGLVERTADPSDRRAQVLRLTGAGTTTTSAVEQAHAADVETRLARLDADERATLAGLLRRLAEDA